MERLHERRAASRRRMADRDLGVQVQVKFNPINNHRKLVPSIKRKLYKHINNITQQDHIDNTTATTTDNVCVAHDV